MKHAELQKLQLQKNPSSSLLLMCVSLICWANVTDSYLRMFIKICSMTHFNTRRSQIQHIQWWQWIERERRQRQKALVDQLTWSLRSTMCCLFISRSYKQQQQLVTSLERRYLNYHTLDHTQPKISDTEHTWGRKVQTERNALLAV